MLSFTTHNSKAAAPVLIKSQPVAKGKEEMKPTSSFIKGVIQKLHKLVFLYQGPKFSHMDTISCEGGWKMKSLAGWLCDLLKVVGFSYQKKGERDLR